MKTLKNLHREILKEFSNKKELVSCNYSCEFDNYFKCKIETSDFLDENITSTLDNRKKNESHFYNYLLHQLFSHLQEIKYYSPVNLNDTRRIICVSHDCISSIQVLIREEIHVILYFRSSDFDGALLVDLDFIGEIPNELIKHCTRNRNMKGYEECTTEFLKKLTNSKVKLNLSFGSLHRT